GDFVRLRWALQAALVQAARLEGGRARARWQAVVLSIRPDALPAESRPLYNALLADVITFARPGVPWEARAQAASGAESSGPLARAVEARKALGAAAKPGAAGPSVRRR